MQEAERAARAARCAEATDRLAASGVRAVALTFVDNTGVTRVKSIPLTRLERAGRNGVGMSPCFDVFLIDDTMTQSKDLGGPDGDLRLLPDPDGIAVLGGVPGWAWAPVDRYTQDGAVYPSCQRSFARRMTDVARERGLRFSMAFEIEWALGRPDSDDFVPAITGPAYGMTRLTQLADYGLDLLDALAAAGVEVEQFHPEYAAGQCEVSVAPTDPVAAADRSVLVRQVIRATSERHGMRATFAPVVVPGAVGNGGHVHLSAWRDGNNIFAGGNGPYGMTGEAAALVGGLVAELPALAAVGAPSPASYLRLVPSHWAGAYQAWGRETRETAVRFVTGMVGTEGRAANVEVKCFDLAANPYLVAGALIGAAMAGLDTDATLPEETVGDPVQHESDGARRLPQTLTEATDALERSEPLRAAMGDVLFDAFVAVRRAEAAAFAGSAPDAVAAATRWVY